MTQQPTRNIAIAGAGLVGSLLAILLRKKGHNVTVYEKRPDMRKNNVDGGRSINLALSDRGWKALELAGIADEIRNIAIPMYGRQIHQQDGSEDFQPYGIDDQAIYSVSRAELNQQLMTAAEKVGVMLVFDHGLESIDREDSIIHFKDRSVTDPDMIIGADGAFSRVRLSMMLQTDQFDYHQSFLQHGYKELTIPSGESGDWLIKKNALHIWPRKHFMLIALPNLDGSFTCTLFAPFKGPDGTFESLHNREQLIRFFTREMPDVLSLIPDLEEDFFNNPTSSLVTIRCQPWNYKDKVLLVGDAGHAIVPFYGQGMNSGFEDCSILWSLMEQYTDWGKIFEKFSFTRKSDADAIAELAIQNFLEMRDRVADDDFLKRKEIAKRLFRLDPSSFMPVYSAVTFSHIPYAMALELGRKQELFFQEIMVEPEWSQPVTDGQLKKWLTHWKEKYTD